MKLKLSPTCCILAGILSTGYLKTCKKQPIKITDQIVNTVSATKKPIMNILVADDFKNSTIDIDGDFLSDVSHGFVTSSLIEQGLPNANVIKKNIFPKSTLNSFLTASKLDSLFTSVLENTKKGKIFDAINLSVGFSVKYESLSREVGFELNHENIADFAQDVKQALIERNGNFMIKSKPMKEIVSIIEKMDKISAKGTKIYIAAGNSGDSSFNLLTLADNIINVGAVNNKGNFVTYSDKNTLVNRIENGDICPKAVKGGFDITDDGIADVKKEETTAIFHFTTPFAKFEGTSFASPRALVKDLLKKNKQN